MAVARLPRFDIPRIPQHVIQRGNDRQPCFRAHADYRRYLADLLQASRRFQCAIHAYVLMTNHVHLLVTPAGKGDVSRMMQAIGRRYVGWFNACYARTGTLWEGRFKSMLVGDDRYFLTCQRYIELNPVRAGLARHPASYAWSSHASNAYGAVDELLTPHDCYLALAPPERRLRAYRELFDEAVAGSQLAELRRHAVQQRPWGTEGFRARVERLAGRALARTNRGRPPRNARAVADEK